MIDKTGKKFVPSETRMESRLRDNLSGVGRRLWRTVVVNGGRDYGRAIGEQGRSGGSGEAVDGLLNAGGEW